MKFTLMLLISIFSIHAFASDDLGCQLTIREAHSLKTIDLNSIEIMDPRADIPAHVINYNQPNINIHVLNADGRYFVSLNFYESHVELNGESKVNLVTSSGSKKATLICNEYNN